MKFKIISMLRSIGINTFKKLKELFENTSDLNWGKKIINTDMDWVMS